MGNLHRSARHQRELKWHENASVEDKTENELNTKRDNTKTMTNRRLQIDLDEEKIAELEALMKEGKASTKKEYVNAALTLMKWAMDEKRAGRIIASVDPERDSYKEIVMPILSEVKKAA
jgi:Arc/MetJ family transcription regulator